MTEDDIEQQAIAWLQDAGWDFRRGPTSRPTARPPPEPTGGKWC